MMSQGRNKQQLPGTQTCYGTVVPGFPVNSYESIQCSLNGRDFMINPEEGTFVFVSDWQSFEIPEDVLIMNIENMENFRMIRQQRTLFTAMFPNKRLLLCHAIRSLLIYAHGWSVYQTCTYTLATSILLVSIYSFLNFTNILANVLLF